jgi:ribosome-binding protein aMBF1 (putative translation factor)
LLERQDDILYEEHDKFVSVQKSLALELKRNEILSSESSACQESVSSLKNLNDELNVKLEEANATGSCVEHVAICNRCKDFDVNSCGEHLISIAKLNDEVASLNAQLKTCKIDFDKLKFARDAYTVGRHPSIKDGLGFRQEAKNLTSQRAPIPNKEKGKAPMASSSQKCHAYIYDRKYSRNAYYNRSYNHDAFNSHDMFASSSTFNGRSTRNNVVSRAPRKVYNESTTIYHACNTSFALVCKNEKIIARKLGTKCKGDKTCILVPKAIVTNLVGPNKSWVPKTQV